MSGQIVEYYRKHRQLIEENLELSRDPNDIEAIHNLRLSIKRMRVVARLADTISNGKFNSKQQLQGIDKLFRRGGRLRDMHVAMQLLLEYEVSELQTVVDYIETRELKRRRRFEEILGCFDPATLESFEAELLLHTKGVDEKALNLAAYTLLSELEFDIHRIYHSSTDEERLHRIRGRLKNINYLNNIFDEQLPVSDHLNISIEKLQELGEVAGTWHDCLNLESILGKNIANDPDASDAIIKVLTEINAKKKELHDEYVCILINEMKV